MIYRGRLFELGQSLCLKKFPLLIIMILLVPILNYFSIFITDDTLMEAEHFHSEYSNIRLMNTAQAILSDFNRQLKSESVLFCSFLENDNYASKNENKTGSRSPDLLGGQYLRFGIMSQYDLNITKISPEAMESNESSMEFLMNVTIVGGEGQIISPIVNLTISNGTNFDITNSVSDWKNVQGDEFSFNFDLNDTTLAKLEIGTYNLVLWTRMWTGVDYYYSSDSIPNFKMKDLRIDSEFMNIFPSEFNNKLDTNQSFNITIRVQEYDDNGLNDVHALSGVNATIVSSTESGLIVPLHFCKFHAEDSPSGFYTFEVNLTAKDAKKFDENNHILNVSITTPQGLHAYNSIDTFEAKGTVLLVQLQEITIESNDPLDYSILPFDNGINHVPIRVNINDSIRFTYKILENSTTPTLKEQTHLLNYQDPNHPEDPSAIISITSFPNGTGTIILKSNILSLSEGYTVLFYVRGHKSSQEIDKSNGPSNITIYWDQLFYEFTYQDNSGNIGTSGSDNLKARGVDVGNNWTFELKVYYDSDDKPAFGTYISYRFGISSSWTDLVDGMNGDPEDGGFLIRNASITAKVVQFECQIINGSLLSHSETFYVNRLRSGLLRNFILDVTWTYLKIDITRREVDGRLGTGDPTGINVSAVWAHDSSNFNGILMAKGHDGSILRPIDMNNGQGVWLGLLKTAPGKYRYSIVEIISDPLGITLFTNSTGDQPNERIVFTDIIWDDVYFSFSYDMIKWDIKKFYTNYGQSTILYCWGRHSYNRSANTPFTGTAVLYDLDNTDPYNLTFDGQGIAWIQLDRTDAHRGVEFRVWSILEEIKWNVKKVRLSDSNSVEIVWEKVVITLEAKKTYSHGTWANISVSLDYEVSQQAIDPSQLIYSVFFSNGSIYENVSWRYFLDYSRTIAVHYYNITSIYDPITGITENDVLFRWLDKNMDPEFGNLTIYWVDDKQPIILEFQYQDFGNGTILLIIDATDNSETWEGSGIEDYGVVLIDERFGELHLAYPQMAKKFDLESIGYPSGVFRFTFTIQFNRSFSQWGDQFWFVYGENLSFSAEVTDRGTPNFKGRFNPITDLPLGRNLTAKTEIIQFTAVYDRYKPKFNRKNMISEINISYWTLESENINLKKLNDGNISISVFVQDELWSGLNINSVTLNITGLSSSFDEYYHMIFIGDIRNLANSRSELQFSLDLSLPVNELYRFTAVVTDSAGNSNSASREVEIEDHVAPRVRNVISEPTNDRRLKVTVEIEENGLGVEYVMIGVKTKNDFSQDWYIQWYNLTQNGGSGSYITSLSQIKKYSGIVNLGFNIESVLLQESYEIIILISDKNGNIANYATTDLLEDWGQSEVVGQIPPLIFNPTLLMVLGLFLFLTIVVGIRIASRTEGYDIKRIITESVKISREEILTQMDEFALGVTVNFFDQVQGPVPVIWEPALLEDQEQVMLDLSDKSFSTLEFVETEDDERSGTFDFSTGSYECTALGYSFALDNPKARGGKENLTIVLLLRKEWGDNLLIFQDELLEEIRKIHKMIKTQLPPNEIEKQARQLREFVSKLMISFEKIYHPKEKKEGKKVE